MPAAEVAALDMRLPHSATTAQGSLFQSRNEPEGEYFSGRRVFVLSGRIYCQPSSWRWECGNRFYRFPRFVGRAENSIIVFRAFHKPSFPRSTSTAAGVHADFLISSNIVYLACCMRRAASVSLMVAATRLSAARLSPGRRNCCGRSSESSFSNGVCHRL